MESDLPGLSTGDARALAHLLDGILRELHFDTVNRELRLPQYGGDYDVRPFPMPASPVDVADMKVRLRQGEKTSPTGDERSFARRIRYAFLFFMFGEPLAGDLLKQLFGRHERRIIEEGLQLGLFVRAQGQTIRMNGLSLFSRQLGNGESVHLFADTPPYFERRTDTQRVYAGADSYELIDRISRMRLIRGCCVEMGSGSGVQLIAALKQHSGITMAIGKEIDPRAANVAVFNAALNGVADKVTIVDSDLALHAALGGCPVSAAFSNPPFLAMPHWVDFDPGDLAIVEGLADIRQTDRGQQLNLQSVFPGAGWGGEDGLAVTKPFVAALIPKLAPAIPLVIYSQFAGDSAGPVQIREYSQRAGFDFTFEPLPSRPIRTRHPQTNQILEARSNPVLTADQAAETVARLIVSALLARREPRRLQTTVRRSSPEHRLVANLSKRIQESYSIQGITHFHDGFAVLIKQTADPIS